MAEINTCNNSKLGLMSHWQSAQRLPALSPSNKAQLVFWYSKSHLWNGFGTWMLKTNRAQKKNTLISLRTAKTEREAQEIRTEQGLGPKCCFKALFTRCWHDEISFWCLKKEKESKNVWDGVWSSLCQESWSLKPDFNPGLKIKMSSFVYTSVLCCSHKQ